MKPSIDVSSAAVKYLWDFFGPHAERTATHFEKHLREFLLGQDHAQIVIGRESAGEGHHAIFCLPPPEFAETLRGALRPNRAVSV